MQRAPQLPTTGQLTLHLMSQGESMQRWGWVVGGAGGWPGRGWGCHLVPQTGVAFLGPGSDQGLPQVCRRFLGTREQEPPSPPITGRPRTLAGHPGRSCCLPVPHHRWGNRLSGFSPQVFPECPALSWLLRTQKWICHNSCPPGPLLWWERQTPDPQSPQTVLKWMWDTGVRPGPGPCMGVCRGPEDSISGVSPREGHLPGAGAVHQQVPGKEAEAAQARETPGWRLESPLQSSHSPLAP